MDQFGRRLKILRENHGYSQQELANASGIQRQNIGTLEKGRTKDPEQETWEKLAKGFGVSIEELKNQLAALKLDRPTPIEERDRFHRIVDAAEEVYWTEDREEGMRAMLEKWSVKKGVR